MTGTPRVALFPSAFHPHVGGVEELTRQLALELRRRGTPPLILTHRYPHDLPQVDEVDGLSVRRERFSTPELRPRALIGYARHAHRSRRGVAAAIDDFRPDVLHVQCVSNNARYVLEEKRRTDLPLVVSLQGEIGMDATGIYQRSAALRRVWRHLIDAADVVTGCSQYVLDEAEDLYRRPLGGRGQVIPNGVALSETSGIEPYQHPRPYVLGIGRMVPQKGFDLLIHAFHRLASRHAGVDLLLAGDGSERSSLEELVSRLGLLQRIHFLGAQPHRQALSLFKGAEVFVLSSRHEPQGIVVLEAMAMQTPVVAARVGGVPEIVRDGTNGWLFNGSDPDDLSLKLDNVLSDETASASTADAARATVALHDWSTITDQYETSYARAGWAK